MIQASTATEWAIFIVLAGVAMIFLSIGAFAIILVIQYWQDHK